MIFLIFNTERNGKISRELNYFDIFFPEHSKPHIVIKCHLLSPVTSAEVSLLHSTLEIPRFLDQRNTQRGHFDTS